MGRKARLRRMRLKGQVMMSATQAGCGLSGAMRWFETGRTRAAGMKGCGR
jgi:hypothetical protein